jgi:hypothetical protein
LTKSITNRVSLCIEAHATVRIERAKLTKQRVVRNEESGVESFKMTISALNERQCYSLNVVRKFQIPNRNS